MVCSSSAKASRLEFSPESSVKEPEATLSKARSSINYICSVTNSASAGARRPRAVVLLSSEPRAASDNVLNYANQQ